MDLINKKVRHITFGEGVIKESKDKYVVVEFEEKTAEFVYPDAFEKFLKFFDVLLQNEVEEYIEEINKEKEEKRIADEEKHKIEQQKSVVLKENKSVIPRNNALSKRSITLERISNRPIVFFVFQGSTFDKEYEGGYIWAPIYSKSGSVPHHWERLLEVRKGDIIIHGCDGYIKAVSRACDKCYDCVQPLELENMWAREGRKVDCEYTYIKNQIKTSEFVDDIVRLSNYKYSPFDKDGNGNMGYLYEINPVLAKIFIKALVDKNKYLNDVEYIRCFINEENNFN